jgi:hypothetical protein
MSTAKTKVYLSCEAYLDGEQRSPVKHEYVGGQVYAMVGGSPIHNLIAGNLYTALRGRLRSVPVWLVLGALDTASSAPPDAVVWPRLDCTVETSIGSFFGYTPPQAGDRLSLDLGAIAKIRLSFSSGAHIPVDGRFTVIRKVHAPSGQPVAMRLRAPQAEGSITLDVYSAQASPPLPARVWILHEQPLMSGIAILGCAGR